MLVKKLAVPFINEKLLAQAEHCTIATASLSLGAFDFVRSRLQPKCKVDILTGLHGATDPEVMVKILKHYSGRIFMRIFTQNDFHANVYILDLPFRKAVAFVGSGPMTFGGIKDDEHVFYKITDPKEIEHLKSWFTGCYEFAESLSEEIVQEYSMAYPFIKQKMAEIREERIDALSVTTKGFRWDSIKFKNQFFKKDDYDVFSNENAKLLNPLIQEARGRVADKFQELRTLLLRDIGLMKLSFVEEEGKVSYHVTTASDKRIRDMYVRLSRTPHSLNKYPPGTTLQDFLSIQLKLRHNGFQISLAAAPYEGKLDRDNLRVCIANVDTLSAIKQTLFALGTEFHVNAGGERYQVSGFTSDQALHDVLATDNLLFNFSIGRSFSPGDTNISTEKIIDTLVSEIRKLNELKAVFRYEL